MAMVENWKKKIKAQKEAAALFTVFAAIQIVIYTGVWGKPMVWDSAIYVAMGKHLFSLGNIGLWEVLRPPLIPIITGLIWKSGLPIVPFSRLIHFALTLGGSMIIYRQLKKIFDYRTAVYTLSVLLSMPVFISNTTTLLTGIISALLITVSLNMYVQNRRKFSGTLSGIAFLTRFPAVLISPAIGIYEVIENRNQPVEAFKHLVIYAVPVAALLGIYFVLNYLYFGNPLEPITSGLSVPPSDASSIFGIFYLTQLATNPLALLAVPGAYWLVRAREKQYYPYLVSLGVFFIFFEAYHHKEVRYALAFLPFIAVSASYAMKTIQDRFELKTGVFVSIALIIMILSSVPIYAASSHQNRNTKEFYQAFEGLEGNIATNNPGPIQYADFDYRALPQGYLAGIYNQGSIDYYGVNSCAWYDTTGEAGEEIERFNQNISGYETIYKDNSSMCNYTIYKVNQ